MTKPKKLQRRPSQSARLVSCKSRVSRNRSLTDTELTYQCSTTAIIPTYGQESISPKPFGRSSNSTEPEDGERPETPSTSLLASTLAMHGVVLTGSLWESAVNRHSQDVLLVLQHLPLVA